jgi:hypothetical protein
MQKLGFKIKAMQDPQRGEIHNTENAVNSMICSNAEN